MRHTVRALVNWEESNVQNAAMRELLIRENISLAVDSEER